MQYIAEVSHVARALAIILLGEVQPEAHLNFFENSQSDWQPGKLVVAHRVQVANPIRNVSAQNAAGCVAQTFAGDCSGIFC